MCSLIGCCRVILKWLGDIEIAEAKPVMCVMVICDTAQWQKGCWKGVSINRGGRGSRGGRGGHFANILGFWPGYHLYLPYLPCLQIQKKDSFMEKKHFTPHDHFLFKAVHHCRNLNSNWLTCLHYKHWSTTKHRYLHNENIQLSCRAGTWDHWEVTCHTLNTNHSQLIPTCHK